MKAEGREDAVPGLEVAALERSLAYAACPDRIPYGSDWPLAPMGAYRRLIEAIIPKEHHPAVFPTNAERLFRLKA